MVGYLPRGDGQWRCRDGERRTARARGGPTEHGAGLRSAAEPRRPEGVGASAAMGSAGARGAPDARSRRGSGRGRGAEPRRPEGAGDDGEREGGGDDVEREVGGRHELGRRRRHLISPSGVGRRDSRLAPSIYLLFPLLCERWFCYLRVGPKKPRNAGGSKKF